MVFRLKTLMYTHPNSRTEKIRINSEDIEEAKKIVEYKRALSKSRAMKLSLIYATIQLLEQRNAEMRRAKKNQPVNTMRNTAIHPAHFCFSPRTARKICPPSS